MAGRSFTDAVLRLIVTSVVACAVASDAGATTVPQDEGIDRLATQGRPPDPTASPTLRIPRVTRPPRLEDFLQDEPREAEAIVSDFRQYAPSDGAPASRTTVAYVSYDAANLYVVFACRDDKDGVRARLARREDIDADDVVTVHLDTFHDRRHAYVFAVNPLGVQQDARNTEGQASDATFDTLWYSRGQLTPDGYIVWMAIPFRSLRFPRTPTQTWGIALGRVIRRYDETSAWPYLTQRRESALAQYATLDGLNEIAPGRNAQIVPYTVFSRARVLDRASATGPYRSERDLRPGVDAKAVFGGAVTVDATVNPDFSQVESDEPQVTINQRFEVFFPEKRPFFIENAGTFQTPIDLFFSRRIRDPRVGGRVTGKIGAWTVGAIAMDDRAGEAASPADSVGASIAVARLQREFAGQSQAGVLVTDRETSYGFNRVAAADARLKLNENWVLSAQAVRSLTRDSRAGAAMAGGAASAELSQTGRHLVYAARYLDHSPTFRSDLGFIQRVDIRQVQQYVRYYWRPENSAVLLFGPDVTGTVNWNRRGELQDWSVDASFGANLRGPTGMGCRHIEAFELFQKRGFRKRMIDCGLTTSWMTWLELSADYGSGSAINYVPGPGLSPFLGSARTATFGATLRPRARFRVSTSYLYNRLDLPADAPPGAHPARVFDNHIARARLHYQFTRELSLRAIVDYNGVLPDSRLVMLDRTKRLSADFLFTYLLNPGTALYVGYADQYENLGPASLRGPLERMDSPATSVGRQLFVKASYLFRF